MRFLLILITTIGITRGSLADSCRELRATITEKTEVIDGLQVTLREVTKDDEVVSFVHNHVRLKALFADPENEVTIHVQRGHVYLMVGAMRIEGMPLSRMRLKTHNGYTAAQGYMFRLVNLPQDVRENLRQKIREMEGRLTVSCPHTVCRALDEGASIKVGGRRSNILSEPLFRSLLTGDLRHADGSPVAMEIYRLSTSPDLCEQMKGLRDTDRGYIFLESFKLGCQTILGIAGSAIAYAVLSGAQ